MPGHCSQQLQCPAATGCGCRREVEAELLAEQRVAQNLGQQVVVTR